MSCEHPAYNVLVNGTKACACCGVVMDDDEVNHPSHYTSHPSGIECIQITEHMNFCLGNAVKYIWRAGLKGSNVEDLEKARFYVNREIERIKLVQPTFREKFKNSR